MKMPMMHSGKQKISKTTKTTQPAAEILFRTLGGELVPQ
jgi:hypothetical protein